MNNEVNGKEKGNYYRMKNEQNRKKEVGNVAKESSGKLLIFII